MVNVNNIQKLQMLVDIYCKTLNMFVAEQIKYTANTSSSSLVWRPFRFRISDYS